MEINFTDVGNIVISINNVAEEIILNRLYNTSAIGSKLTFEKVDDGFIAKPSNSITFNTEEMVTILGYLNDGSRLMAVKYVKDIKFIGLKEAKDLIDSLPMFKSQSKCNMQQHVVEVVGLHKDVLENTDAVIFTPKTTEPDEHTDPIIPEMPEPKEYIVTCYGSEESHFEFITNRTNAIGVFKAWRKQGGVMGTQTQIHEVVNITDTITL